MVSVADDRDPAFASFEAVADQTVPQDAFANCVFGVEDWRRAVNDACCENHPPRQYKPVRHHHPPTDPAFKGQNFTSDGWRAVAANLFAQSRQQVFATYPIRKAWIVVAPGDECRSAASFVGDQHRPAEPKQVERRHKARRSAADDGAVDRFGHGQTLEGHGRGPCSRGH